MATSGVCSTRLDVKDIEALEGAPAAGACQDVSSSKVHVSD